MSFEEPKITCFVCNWAFSEQELAVSRTRKVANANVVRVMCIGRIDPVTVLETLMKGVDGVLMVGCAPPDCHFVEGNVYAELTVNALKKLLVLTDLEPERLELHWVSPIEEVECTKIIEDFAEQLEKLGPSPLAREKRDVTILENVLAAKNVVADFRLRALIGKEKELTMGVNAYGKRISREEFYILLDEVVKAEFIRHKILLLAKKNPFSVKELAKVLNMKPAVVLRHILNMRRKGNIALDSIEGRTPLYKAVEVR
ncbi:MAG: hydrogenase iron-sulfur subunit [Candidatus Bathyarchaeota archaeon]|nr:hydrogenase iron-sulfur subunit [Candidatus Bathyarchaeota archaeon]